MADNRKLSSAEKIYSIYRMLVYTHGCAADVSPANQRLAEAIETAAIEALNAYREAGASAEDVLRAQGRLKR
ncbi:MAG: hypothetical protein MI723_16685 [Caulobacterales bacterium]|nr:hypothetical protein [Caulobacterales bacterium]